VSTQGHQPLEAGLREALESEVERLRTEAKEMRRASFQRQQYSEAEREVAKRLVRIHGNQADRLQALLDANPPQPVPSYLSEEGVREKLLGEVREKFWSALEASGWSDGEDIPTDAIRDAIDRAVEATAELDAASLSASSEEARSDCPSCGVEDGDPEGQPILFCANASCPGCERCGVSVGSMHRVDCPLAVDYPKVLHDHCNASSDTGGAGA
jgi:hypothetical protein